MSVSEFFYMGGYALYVWGAFGVTAALMIIEPILLRRRKQAAIKRVKRMIRMNSGETV